MYVNLEILKSYTGDDPEFLTEMINKFNHEMPVVLSNLDTSLENGNMEEVKRISHKMIGTTGVFYIGEITPVLQKIEQLCTNGNPGKDEIRPLVNKVREIVEASMAELEAEKTNL